MLLHDLKDVRNGRVISGQKELTLDEDYGGRTLYVYRLGSTFKGKLHANPTTYPVVSLSTKEEIEKWAKENNFAEVRFMNVTDSKTKDADYKDYYDVGKDVGLSGEKLIQYVEYMRQRWPEKEKVQGELNGYCKEWARRFAKGDAWKLSDLSGQRILERMGITDSKSYDSYSVTFRYREGGNTETLEVAGDNEAEATINAKKQIENGIGVDPKNYTIIKVSPGKYYNDSKTKDATTFSKGDKIVANQSVQGMSRGASYTIVDLEEHHSGPWGTFVGYKLQDASGNTFWVNNLHVLATKDSKSVKDQIAELECQKAEAKKMGYGTDAYDAAIKDLQKDDNLPDNCSCGGYFYEIGHEWLGEDKNGVGRSINTERCSECNKIRQYMIGEDGSVKIVKDSTKDGSNIKEMEAGKSREQAIAIAMSKAGKTKDAALFITKQGDKYRLIGAIKEQELHDLSVKGFNSYQEALDAIKKYGYTLYRYHN